VRRWCDRRLGGRSVGAETGSRSSRRDRVALAVGGRDGGACAAFERGRARCACGSDGDHRAAVQRRRQCLPVGTRPGSAASAHAECCAAGRMGNDPVRVARRRLPAAGRRSDHVVPRARRCLARRGSGCHRDPGCTARTAGQLVLTVFRARVTWCRVLAEARHLPSMGQMLRNPRLGVERQPVRAPHVQEAPGVAQLPSGLSVVDPRQRRRALPRQ
jgi:hypothetical protein